MSGGDFAQSVDFSMRQDANKVIQSGKRIVQCMIRCVREQHAQFLVDIHLHVPAAVAKLASMITKSGIAMGVPMNLMNAEQFRNCKTESSKVCMSANAGTTSLRNGLQL